MYIRRIYVPYLSNVQDPPQENNVSVLIPTYNVLILPKRAGLDVPRWEWRWKYIIVQRATMSSKQTTKKSKAGVWEGEEDELAVLIYKSSKTAKTRAAAAAAAAAATEEQMHESSASAGRRT